MAEPKKVYKFPKALGACADKLYELREKRLAMQKAVDEVEAEEKALKEHLIQTLPKSEAGGVAGKLCRVTIVKKKVPQVKDWDKFYAHIKKTGQFDLLGRTVGAAAIKERWEAGKIVPGVENFEAISISINKV